MPKSTPLMGALALSLLLAGCGRGSDDTLADGAVDRSRDAESAASAEDVGPPSASPAAAGPGAAGTGPEPAVSGAAVPAAGATAAAGPTLRIAQGAHGAHLVDASGFAVYVLEGDRMGDKCVGACLQAWPPVLAGDVQPSGEAGLQGALVATVARPDGSRQVTYKGQPLYRYARDSGPGSMAGHALKDAYGTWYLLSPQGAHVAPAEHAAGG